MRLDGHQTTTTNTVCVNTADLYF